MFTTFGPGRSRFETALGQGDKVEVGRVLRTGTLTKEELTDGLYFTCAGSDTSLMSLLLKAGANPNGNPGEQNAAKYTPLMTAIQVGSAEGVQILIGAGATVNVMRDDETPLLIAVNRGTDAITSILLENKADPNVANSFGLTPLMFASHRQTSHTISSLIDHGGLVNTRDRQGRTALMFASESANLSAVQVLIERGADVSVKDSKGNTALSVAATEKVAQTIRTAGAKR
jgi:ankyrin repeat protein